MQSARRYREGCALCQISFDKVEREKVFESEFFLIVKRDVGDFMLIYKYHGRLPRSGERDLQAIRDMFIKRVNPEDPASWHVDMTMEITTSHWHAFLRRK